MKFLKKKTVKWLAGLIITAGLVSFGVPPQVAAVVSNTLAEQAQELVDD